MLLKVSPEIHNTQKGYLSIHLNRPLLILIIISPSSWWLVLICVQVGSSITDAVWIYSLTYGGGIVSVCSFISQFLFPFISLWIVILANIFLLMSYWV